MAKIHTRQKRYLGISSHLRGNKNIFKPKPPGSKSFKTKEAAEKYAKEKKYQKYEIVKPRFGLSKKFKIILK